MCKSIIYLNIIFSVIIFCSGKHRKKENVKNQTISEWSDHLKFFSNISIDIRLHELPTGIAQEETENSTRSLTGVIEVIIPQASQTQFLCFPHSFAEYYQAQLFAHITCRKLGFMTLVAINGEEFPHLLSGSKYYGMKLDSNSCFDQEQIISRCRWNAVSIKACQNVTKVTCGGCQKVAKGFKGDITSPGFPYLNLNDVTCEWSVSVPEKHSIHLSFKHFEELADYSTFLPCRVHHPYVEVIYGIQSKVTIHRYCRFEEVTNISIPFHTVKILIFTGISSSKEKLGLNEKKGFSISFEAIPEEEELLSPLQIVLLGLLCWIFGACVLIFRYIRKHKMLDCCMPKKKNPLQVVDELQDIRLENKVTKNNTQFDKKGLPSTTGFSYNTPRLEKVSYTTLSPSKSFNQIALQNFSDGKQADGSGWRTEKKALQRHSSEPNPNRLSVTLPVYYNSVDRIRNMSSTRKIDLQKT